MVKWMTVNELPKSKSMYKKVAILSEGRFNDGSLHLGTGYWHVYCDNGVMKGKLVTTSIPTEKVKAVAFESDFLDEYNEQVNKTQEVMKNNDENVKKDEKTGFTGWSYTYKDDGKSKPTSEFIKVNSNKDGKVQYFVNGKMKHEFNDIDEYRNWKTKALSSNQEKKNEIQRFGGIDEMFDDFDWPMFEPWRWFFDRSPFSNKWLTDPWNQFLLSDDKQREDEPAPKEEKKEPEKKNEIKDEEKVTISVGELKELVNDAVKKAIEDLKKD